ncbi:YggS family pyridoxal phosphate-dependent enzyme [Candidatus Cyanaurora vandensis]|uniref:YggS family pyridoxal phosphate-dependent enzyme n=1 Tax=Candidatus Cyanaurora vandensis TaxID=2714958 RepID=UPI00257F51CB|nr:YggS family pyridoxal phosphate-dependent enzyme [Candidatus Cyanaurora vandensis]
MNWHFIGRLQSNKTRRALLLSDWIHSVDSLALARQLSTVAVQENCSPRVLLQVKLRADPAKTGWSPTELETQLPELVQLLNVRGLMTIAPFGQASLDLFQELAHWSARWRGTYPQLTELSMGMSGDYPLAVQAGSTMVRLGQAIFGLRPPQLGV